MSAFEIESLVDEGLGNSTYLVDLGDGRALAVDPSRDLRALRAAADRRGLRVSFVAETHLHADFVSGALDLARSDGAVVLASAEGGRAFAHQALRDGDEVDLAGLTLRVLATPGHTHEHLAFTVLDGSRTLGVFSGGSLLVGSAARTDLVDPARTEELARQQYRSLQRLVQLDDSTAVWPTHGAGSFCSAPSGARRTSTIGQERADNALLRAEDEDTFVRQLLDSLGSFPPYFLRLAEVNRRGPASVGRAALTPLDLRGWDHAVAAGAQVVDVRPARAFAEGHIPGALSIPLRPVFATWLGWLLDDDRPLAFVRDSGQDPEEISWQARKVGYERIAGELAGGFATWRDAARPVRRIPMVEAGSALGTQVLDVRQDAEFVVGHVPGAVHVELGRLAAAPHVPTGPTLVMCGHGERAMSAASLLARAGHRDLAVLHGGPESWANAAGTPLETGR